MDLDRHDEPASTDLGFCVQLPVAAIVGIVTLIGFALSKEPKRFPITSVTVTLIIFVIWMNISAVFALPANGSYVWEQWDKVMKIHLFLIITMMVMNAVERVRWLIWVATFSIAFYGIKGGIFTLLRVTAASSSGRTAVSFPQYRDFSGDHDGDAAVALSADTKPAPSIRWAFRIRMALCAVAVVGSIPAGRFLALAAIGIFLWFKTRNKLIIGAAILVLVPLLLDSCRTSRPPE